MLSFAEVSRPVTKKERARLEYIKETQMFQRIAGVPEDSDDVLGQDWDQLFKKHPVAKTTTAIENMRTQSTIYKHASSGRNN